MTTVTRHINNDGTETWTGLPVILPAGLIPEGVEPVEVRSRACAGGACPWIGYDGRVEETPLPLGAVGELRIVLSKTIWTPPASLPDGDYDWNAGTGELTTPTRMVYSTGLRELLGADWTDPPRTGRWRVKDGAATYLGNTR